MYERKRNVRSSLVLFVNFFFYSCVSVRMLRVACGMDDTDFDQETQETQETKITGKFMLVMGPLFHV